MEIFQNGRFSSGGPVYQIGVKQSDGTYDIKVYDIMTKEQAEARLKSMGVKPAPAKKSKKAAAPKVPNYSNMSKIQLEKLMRKYNIELDRRKSKAVLLKEVDAFFSGEWAIS
jgi:hypothetical protein